MYINEYILMAFAFLLVMTPVVVMLVLAEEERRHEAYARQLQIQIGKQRREIDSLNQRLHGYDLDMAGMETMLAQARAELKELRPVRMTELPLLEYAEIRARDQRTLDVASAFHEA